ncbi:MAG TPA: thioredoxin domain-containing protein, partial [Longimicrobiaceae bacterium]
MAENGNTVTVTDDNFQTEIAGANGLAVVDFWAEWCGPCRMVGPIVEQLAQEYQGRVKVGKLDVDSNPRAAAQFNV